MTVLILELEQPLLSYRPLIWSRIELQHEEKEDDIYEVVKNET